MASHQQGKGTKTIGLYFELEMHENIRRRAESLGVSTAMYIKLILGRWLESGMKLKLKEKQARLDSISIGAVKKMTLVK
jgi:hypothetical protein